MTSFTDVGTLPQHGLLATYDGVEHTAAVSISESDVSVYFDSREQWLAFSSPAELARFERLPSVFGVTLPRASVDRLFTRVILATWFTEPVVVHAVAVPEGNVTIPYDRDPSFGKARGMAGNQYEGFRATVPFAELADVHIREREHPPWVPHACTSAEHPASASGRARAGCGTCWGADGPVTSAPLQAVGTSALPPRADQPGLRAGVAWARARSVARTSRVKRASTTRAMTKPPVSSAISVCRSHAHGLRRAEALANCAACVCGCS